MPYDNTQVITLTCTAGKQYIFSINGLAGSRISQAVGNGELRFHDEENALRFIKRLPATPQFWQKLAHQLPHFGHRDNNVLELVAKLLIRGRIKLYQGDGASPIAAKTLKNSRGQIFRIANPVQESEFSLRKAKRFSHKDDALSFLNDLKMDDQYVQALKLFIPKTRKSNATTPAVTLGTLEIVAEEIVNGSVVVLDAMPHRKFKVEEEENTVEQKQAPLGPHSENGSSVRQYDFKVKVVDHVGKAVDGVDITLTANGQHVDLVSSGGMAEQNSVPSKFAIANVADIDQLIDKIAPHWDPYQEISVQENSATTVKKLDEADAGISLTGDVLHTLAILPPLGKIHLILTDKTQQYIHAKQAYTIEGPISLSGETDENGMLTHADVPPGDYTLTLNLAFFEDTDYALSDEYTLPIVVHSNETQVAQRRSVGVVPQAKRASIRGIVFDTNKSFVLPNALPAMRYIRNCINENPFKDYLILGHTDTTGEPEVNDPLSEERANNTRGFLEDDVDTWLAMYGSGIDKKQRWGAREDRLMIRSLPDFRANTASDLVRWFQKKRKLKVDGIAGPNTRTQLIKEYMLLDGEDFKESFAMAPSITTLGLGERYPLDENGTNIDKAAEDNKKDLRDRRIEFYFFDPEFGIYPPVSDKEGKEYIEWFAQASLDKHEIIEGNQFNAIHIDVNHALFHTGSAVMLPEGKNPTEDKDGSTSAVGVLASALRYNAENNRLQKMLLAGHTDSVGADASNKKLSEQRAELVHAVLMGNRDTFCDIAKATGKVSDWKQILRWTSEALAIVPPLKKMTLKDINNTEQATLSQSGFEKCNPPIIDNNSASGKTYLKAFQQVFNNNLENLSSPASKLVVDGVMGAKSWGAIFDCYQYNLAQELGADLKGVKTLREKVRFLESENPYIGFGEAHPADGNSQDNMASQENRRVEILFFDLGEEPDLAVLAESPELCEVYLPDQYSKKPLPAMASTKPWFAFWENSECSSSTAGVISMFTPGLKEGEKISISVENSVTHERVEFETTSKKDKYKAEFNHWDLGLLDAERKEFAENQDFPLVNFQFKMVSGGRRVASSNVITFVEHGSIDIKFEINEEQSVSALEYPYLIMTLLGSRKGVTGKGKNSALGHGGIALKNIPPGGVNILADENYEGKA